MKEKIKIVTPIGLKRKSEESTLFWDPGVPWLASVTANINGIRASEKHEAPHANNSESIPEEDENDTVQETSRWNRLKSTKLFDRSSQQKKAPKPQKKYADRQADNKEYTFDNEWKPCDHFSGERKVPLGYTQITEDYRWFTPNPKHQVAFNKIQASLNQHLGEAQATLLTSSDPLLSTHSYTHILLGQKPSQNAQTYPEQHAARIHASAQSHQALLQTLSQQFFQVDARGWDLKESHIHRLTLEAILRFPEHMKHEYEQISYELNNIEDTQGDENYLTTSSSRHQNETQHAKVSLQNSIDEFEETAKDYVQNSSKELTETIQLKNEEMKNLIIINKDQGIKRAGRLRINKGDTFKGEINLLKEQKKRLTRCAKRIGAMEVEEGEKIDTLKERVIERTTHLSQKILENAKQNRTLWLPAITAEKSTQFGQWIYKKLPGETSDEFNARAKYVETWDALLDYYAIKACHQIKYKEYVLSQTKSYLTLIQQLATTAHEIAAIYGDLIDADFPTFKFNEFTKTSKPSLKQCQKWSAAFSKYIEQITTIPICSGDMIEEYTSNPPLNSDPIQSRTRNPHYVNQGNSLLLTIKVQGDKSIIWSKNQSALKNLEKGLDNYLELANSWSLRGWTTYRSHRHVAKTLKAKLLQLKNGNETEQDILDYIGQQLRTGKVAKRGYNGKQSTLATLLLHSAIEIGKEWESKTIKLLEEQQTPSSSDDDALPQGLDHKRLESTQQLNKNTCEGVRRDIERSKFELLKQRGEQDEAVVDAQVSQTKNKVKGSAQVKRNALVRDEEKVKVLRKEVDDLTKMIEKHANEALLPNCSQDFKQSMANPDHVHIRMMETKLLRGMKKDVQRHKQMSPKIQKQCEQAVQEYEAAVNCLTQTGEALVSLLTKCAGAGIPVNYPDTTNRFHFLTDGINCVTVPLMQAINEVFSTTDSQTKNQVGMKLQKLAMEIRDMVETHCGWVWHSGGLAFQVRLRQWETASNPWYQQTDQEEEEEEEENNKKSWVDNVKQTKRNFSKPDLILSQPSIWNNAKEVMGFKGNKNRPKARNA